MTWKPGLLGAAGLAGLAIAAAPLTASTPPAGSVSVPATVGQTASDAWTGTVPQGTNRNSDCTASAPEQIDEHAIAVDVPAGAYDAVRAVFTFRITWTRTSPNNATSDLIMTLVAPNGLAIGSADGSATTETLSFENLGAGTYRVLVCGFVNAADQPYAGTLTVQAQTREPSLPAAPAEGLEFGAAVAADNQRDEAEPIVEIDRAGNIYACGPSGFSQAADYLQVSKDGGDQFHLIGVPPRGQASAAGGGDCTVAFGLQPNSLGHYDYAYSGLGALSGFSTSISPDNGHRIATGGFNLDGGVTNTGGVADRQWQTFVSETDVLLIYNIQVPRHTVVLRSTDKGLTFDPTTGVRGNSNPRFPGQIRYDDVHDVVYFPWDVTGAANLSVSFDKGRTWSACRVGTFAGNNPGFVSADHDSEGNIYVAYASGAPPLFETYMKVLPRENLSKCNRPATTPSNSLTDPGFGPQIRVDRDPVRTTVFPWITAGSAPGRAAVMFLGTETNGNPNVGTFRASWDAYVNVTTNALSPDATFSQVKATTHPMHYDSICLNGLNCDLTIPPGDRSMADFMAVDWNPVTDRLSVVFNRTNKVPNEALGRVASPMVSTQIGGPTLGGVTLTPTRPAVRSSSSDPAGDALSSYSSMAPLVLPPQPGTTNEPAADFVSASIGPELDLHDGSKVENGGFTVTMKLADLSTASLLETAARTRSQSLLWLLRFTNGHQDAAASARWNPVQGFTFGYNDYVTGSAPCEPSGPASSDKCILYPGDTPIQGDVDQRTGTIRLAVPRHLLRGLSGDTGNLQRPVELPAEVGTRFYDATAWSLGNTVSPIQAVQSFLYPLDNTPAMDFLLPPDGAGEAGPGCAASGGGSIGAPGQDGRFTLDVHSGLEGDIAYRDKGAGVDFASTSISSITCAGSSATITGTGVDGEKPALFVIQAVDRGEPGRNDTFSITLSSGHSRAGTLTRGNIQVRE